MNFISWATKPTIINENTQSYIPQELVEESIAKTLKPVMNKMKKLNIGVPYRDSRVSFLSFYKINIQTLSLLVSKQESQAGKT